MVTITDLIGSPLSDLRLAAGPAAARAVTGITILESVDDLAGVNAGDFLLLTRAAATDVSGYRLDVTLRQAGASGASGVGIPGLIDAGVGETSRRTAERFEVALVALPSGSDLAGLVVELDGMIRASDDALARQLPSLLAALDGATSATPSGLVALGAQITGLPFVLGERSSVRHGIGVEADAGEPLVIGLDSEPTALAGVALRLLCDAVSRLLQDERRRLQVPMLPRAAVLTELLLSSRRPAEDLLDRARTLGVAVDGWHVVVRVELQPIGRPDDGEFDGEDPAEVYQRLGMASRLLLGVLAGGPGVWHAALLEGAVVLTTTRRDDPGPGAAADVVARVRDGIVRVREALADVDVVCGVGDAHPGVDGLRASAAEARAAAAAARMNARVNEPVALDLTGLNRMLFDWMASETARQSTQELLGPLASLGPARADTALRTLKAYLDAGGSASRAGRTLFLHRNAVAYRIRHISEVLGIDLEDPDQRFAVELACRARLASRVRETAKP